MRKALRRRRALCVASLRRRRPRSRGASRRIATSCGARSSCCRRSSSRSSSTIRDELVMRVERSRSVAQRRLGGRAPNHSIDFGVHELGPYPFTALPREYGAAVEKFGVATLQRDGLLPWRRCEEFGNLRRTFEGLRERRSPTSTSDLVLFSAVLAHYIQDAHQPLHATNNYDGQLTGQTGIHSPLRGRSVRAVRVATDDHAGRAQADHQPARRRRSTSRSPSYQLVTQILEADTRGDGRRKSTYDDEYFEKFFTTVRPMLEQQLAGAITRHGGRDHRRLGTGRPPHTAGSRSRPVRRSRSRSALDEPAVYLVPIGPRPLRALHRASETARRQPAPTASVRDAARSRRTMAPDGGRGASSARAPSGRPARAVARDWLVRPLAESIAEQRTLWSLRERAGARRSIADPTIYDRARPASVRGCCATRARTASRPVAAREPAGR